MAAVDGTRRAGGDDGAPAGRTGPGRVAARQRGRGAGRRGRSAGPTTGRVRWRRAAPPAELARRLGRTIPLVYGSAGATAVAAQWWKTQVNLNAKAPAFAAALPELTHDELAGWGQGGDVTRQTMSLVLLRHAGEGPRTGGLFAAVRAATDEVMADMFEVQGEGDDELSRFFDLTLLGTLVSLHLAAGEGVDPGPVPGGRRGAGPRLVLGARHPCPAGLVLIVTATLTPGLTARIS